MISSEPVHDPDMLYRYICRYKRLHDGLSPTIREIGDACGISSTSVVNYNLQKLAKAGLIKRYGGGKTRGIVVVGGEWKGPKEQSHDAPRT